MCSSARRALAIATTPTASSFGCGKFEGRWDDPEGNWRALYVGECPLVCYLEVLAPFRPDPDLAAEMAEIVTDEDDPFPTCEPGKLPYTWCEPRLRCSGKLSGDFAVPGHHKTLSSLRSRFLGLAKTHGCDDLDAGAIRHGRRALTQAISAWIYKNRTPDDERPVDGVEYLSRHGDEFKLWAIYERGTEHKCPPQIHAHFAPHVLTPEDPDLIAAMEIHKLEWIQD